jgi:hypothetical protein
MAIVGPADLPAVLKLNDSNPLKRRTMFMLGYPNVQVELTEPQLEESLRIAGNFIATYFPQEERYAYFYTAPLQSEYDLPPDAYWIREVGWDPVANRIQDIFGADMFLFCISADDSKVLTENGLKHHKDLIKEDKLITPFGPEEYTIEFHEQKQQLVKIDYGCGHLKCTTNQPIKVNGFDVNDSLNGWLNASEMESGDFIVTNRGAASIKSISIVEPSSTITIKTKSGCFYACSEGKPIILH